MFFAHHTLHGRARNAGLDRDLPDGETAREFPNLGLASELWCDEGVDLFTIMEQLGHVRADVTMIYLRSMGRRKVLAPIADRRPPMVAVEAALATD